MSPQPRSLSFILLALFCLFLAGCSPPGQQAELPARCAEPPAFEETAQVLAECLPATASVAEATERLAAWQRIGDEWGEVVAADVTVAPGEEMIVVFYRSLREAPWNPRAHLSVWERGDHRWQVVYEGDDLAPEDSSREEWGYRLGDPADITGDGLVELPVEIFASNGLRYSQRYLSLLSSDRSRTLTSVYHESVASHYRLATDAQQPRLELVMGANPPAITRTLTFDGVRMVENATRINPAAATTSAALPGGSVWYGFDRVGSIGGSLPEGAPFGLYRQQNGTLTHQPLDAPVYALAVGPDDALYVAAGCGLLRLDERSLEPLAAPEECGESSATGSGSLLTIGFGPEGEVWVGGPFTLARYDGTWQRYPINATNLLVAADGVVWAQGWNGRANSNCCFTRLEGSAWTTFTYDAPLPLAPALEEAVRALISAGS